MNEIKEFAEKIVQIHRVSKKTKGGNKIGFSVVLVVGDRKGQVGVGLGKAPDVKNAIKKGVRYARKHLITVPLTKTGSIPHDIYLKFGAAKVLLRKAPEGTGVIAGGAVRAVVEAAGVRNIVSKVLGTSNQASNVYACLEALKQLKSFGENRHVQEDVAGGYESKPADKKEITKEKVEVAGVKKDEISENPEEKKLNMAKKSVSKQIKKVKTEK